MTERFTKKARLCETGEYRTALTCGRRVDGRGLSLVTYHRRLPGRRLGLAIGRPAGQAVARNRIKRRLREFFRRHAAGIVDGVDLIVMVHRDLSRLSGVQFRAELHELFARAELWTDGPRRGGVADGEAKSCGTGDLLTP
ncbi:MAG: ribonuclease P protein component [Candidatus Methylomirabilales bacterium]